MQNPASFFGAFKLPDMLFCIVAMEGIDQLKDNSRVFVCSLSSISYIK